MNRKQFLKNAVGILCFCAVTGMLASGNSPAAETKTLQPGQEIEISFADAGLPPTLYSMMNGTAVTPCVTVRLPDDYNPTNTYPLLVYVPGNDGGTKGNIYNAETIAAPAAGSSPPCRCSKNPLTGTSRQAELSSVLKIIRLYPGPIAPCWGGCFNGFRTLTTRRVRWRDFPTAPSPSLCWCRTMTNSFFPTSRISAWWTTACFIWRTSTKAGRATAGFSFWWVTRRAWAAT